MHEFLLPMHNLDCQNFNLVYFQGLEVSKLVCMLKLLFSLYLFFLNLPSALGDRFFHFLSIKACISLFMSERIVPYMSFTLNF